MSHHDGTSRLTYPEGVRHHSPGSRQRTLGKVIAPATYPERVAQASPPCETLSGFAGRWRSAAQGRASAPWEKSSPQQPTLKGLHKPRLFVKPFQGLAAFGVLLPRVAPAHPGKSHRPSNLP